VSDSVNNTVANVTPINDTVSLIRAEVKKAKGAAEGTIVRFDKVRRRRIHPSHGLPEGARLERTSATALHIEEIASTYAALFVGGRWYVTGNVSTISQEQPYTNRAFFDLLAEADIRNVAIATAFQAIEDEDEPA
jgi:hypothetical protein